MKTDALGLSDMARTTLEVYRLVLSPAVYCFASEMADGKSTGEIIELRMPHAGSTQEKEFGVVFGFWPDGFELDRSPVRGRTIRAALHRPFPELTSCTRRRSVSCRP